jgi:hypothetical protein
VAGTRNRFRVDRPSPLEELWPSVEGSLWIAVEVLPAGTRNVQADRRRQIGIRFGH